MPDVHAGKGCTIGTTMTITDKVVPGMVGVDIGCGMQTVKIKERDIDCEKLDALIRAQIPCGREIRDTPHEYSAREDLSLLRCAQFLNLDRAARSVGTLGGGNHFIEADRSDAGDIYLVVHSGSRHLGLEVADYYQREGAQAMRGAADYQTEELIASLRSQGRFAEIQPALEKLKKARSGGEPYELAYVEGRLFEDYIHDMRIVQRFAALNRMAMADVIISGMGLEKIDEFTTIHNYIDTDSMILRKGSVSAKAGEKLIIPINMRDGSLICIGRGNPEWNFSAPHGAGRRMSRHSAFAQLSMERYREEMKDIYTTCVVPDTLDESPMAYKSMDEIVKQIGPTAQISERIRPVYNFKATL
jgi:RNA-splicing ligase RtcB